MISKKGTRRFKKGSEVEVLNIKELPAVSWHSAEIVSGNGHTYQVRYVCHSPNIGVVVERVPRKALRPCPPPVQGPKNWVPGDIVELFEDNSWKLAQVSEVAGGDVFVILLGTSRVQRANICDLRVQQTWQDNKWIVIHKEPRKFIRGVMKGKQKIGYASQSLTALRSRCEDEHCLVDDGLDFQRSTNKRSLPDYGTRSRAKIRIVVKERRCQPMAVLPSSRFVKKVDADASPHEVFGENYMHASLNKNRVSRFLEINSDWSRPDIDRNLFVNRLDTSDCESVGSCSVNNISLRSDDYPIGSIHDLNNEDDDTKAFSVSEGESGHHTRKESAAEAHGHELQAYRCTMMAFFVSGPLSWEKELLLSDLRHMLHISEDEHLSEVKHLLSSKRDI